MKKILISIILLISVGTIVYGASSSVDKSPTMSEKTRYELYQERIENFCKEYKKTDGTSEIFYTINENYKDFDKDNSTSTDGIKDLKEAQEKYRKDMNGIYDCAVSLVEYRTLSMITDTLIKQNPKMAGKLSQKITQRMQEIKNSNSGNGNCKFENGKKDILLKKSVLKQATYEYCRYSFYLEYLRELNQEIKFLGIQPGENGYNPIGEIISKESEKQAKITEEINDTIKTFPIVFKTYSEFENNASVHLLFQLLREDYLVFREELHKNLNPINQVVYKVANAMRK